MPRLALCLLADLVEGQLLIDVPGTDATVLVVQHADGLHIVDAHCPHQYAPLLGGEVEAGVLTCPMHGWRFDLRTGQSPDSPCAVQCWTASVEDGVVWVEVAR